MIRTGVMIFLAIWYIVVVQKAYATICVNKIFLRNPRENDIGLIFDLTVANVPQKKKEMLEFIVHSDGTCSLNLTNNQIMADASRIVGGNFGFIKPGTVETVSLIWPTTSLFNRVGYCPIIITTSNIDNEKIHMRQLIHFDTRFTTLDPEGHNLRKLKGYRDCQNWDKDYLKNCTPINCEERYFGRRNFYNTTSEQCEEVPRCEGSNLVYDNFANECIDPRNFCSTEDIQSIRQGSYQDTVLDLKIEKTFHSSNVVDEHEDHNIYSQFKSDDLIEGSKDDNKHGIARSIDPQELAALTEDESSSSGLPYWLKGVADGLLIVGVIIFFQVLATLAIYVLICFMIFLIGTWLIRRNCKNTTKDCYLLSVPSASNITIMTASSLLSYER